MKLRTRIFLLTACLIFAIPMIAGADAVGTFPSELNPVDPGQVFYGDGAVYSDGYLVAPESSTGGKCLSCHRDKSTYLRTGHGNMFVKVNPGEVYKGPDGLPYEKDAAGHDIDWTNRTVSFGGITYPLLYTIGGWMTVDAPDLGLKGGTDLLPTLVMQDGRNYGTCGSCHNTGYKAATGTPLVYDRPQPFVDYPEYLLNPAPGFSGSWVLNGIQCERCHDASTHDDPLPSVPSRTNSTALCSQCHIRPAAWENGVIPPAAPPAAGFANPNWATQPTAYPIGASATNFGSHLIGKQFLNSPHGGFTGRYNQIADTSLYGTHFNEGGVCSDTQYTSRTTCEAALATWTRFTGGCATCHDVHQSTVHAAKVNFGAEPIKRECGIACHSSRANLATMNHPTGTGTPFAQATPTTEEMAESCVICHMPKPNNGTGLNVHVFRINTDPTYSTFPAAGATTPGICSNPSFATDKATCTHADTGGYCYDTNRDRVPGITVKADCLSPNKWQAYTWSLVANSAPDGEFVDAVWVDIDLSCGQCHGTNGNAHALPKRTLAGFAAGMHAGNGTPIACTDCHKHTAVAHPAATGAPTQCSDCHGTTTTRAGVKPTVEAACITCHGSAGPALHQFTTAQIADYAAAIHSGGGAPSTTCTVCHAGNPSALIAFHPTTQQCSSCHAKPGGALTVTACNSCHADMSAAEFAQIAPTIHKNAPPQASLTIVAEDRDPAKAGIQVKIGDAVQVIDTTTDANRNILSITCNWGDGTVYAMTPGDTAIHAYARSGNKSITLTVIDSKGVTSKVKQKINVLKAPKAPKVAKAPK